MMICRIIYSANPVKLTVYCLTLLEANFNYSFIKILQKCNFSGLA